MEEFLDEYKQLAEVVENGLHGFVESKNLISEPLIGAIKYSLFSDGKRLRPVLCLGTAKMLGADFKQSQSLALAIEMIHTYSLIHDDLPCMDDDDFRRGKPSCHKIYGEAVALLAGDALLNFAYEKLLSQVNSMKDAKGFAEACLIVAECAGANGMIDGQNLDLKLTGKDIANVDDFMLMNKQKTGKLIYASIISVASLCKLTKEKMNALKSFAENLGLAFQSRDDLLDEIGTKETVGKRCKKDISKGKCTFVKLYGVQRTRQMCAEFTENAIKSLAVFGKSALFLTNVTKLLLDRTK